MALREEPLLSDLEALRPRITMPPEHESYPKFYETTKALLIRSFTVAQMERLLTQLGLELRDRDRKKNDYAELLLRHWKFPVPVRDKEDVDVEMVERDFPLLPSELFLLMGTDGSDLLRLSHTYQARLTPIPNPLRLRAYGQPSHLDAMATEIEDRRAKMTYRNVKLECATGVRPDLIQTISRISGAFIENVGEAEVKITALDDEAAEVARRLAERAGIEATDALTRPMVAQIVSDNVLSDSAYSTPSARTDYALYPFLVPGVLPWTMGYSNPFRVRRVGRGFHQDRAPSSFPRLASGQWTSKDGGVVKSLREALVEGLPPVALGYNRILSATAGYHLVSAPGSQSLARVSLAPPIRDSFNCQTFMDWLIAGKGSTTFLPGVPPKIRAETLKPRRLTAVEDVLLYRLQYQAHEDLPTAKSKKTSSRSRPTVNNMSRKDVFDVQVNFTLWETFMPKSDPAASAISSNTFASPIGSEFQAEEQPGRDRFTPPSSAIPPRVLTARRGPTSNLDVLLPERQFDLRLSVQDVIRVGAGEIPQDLEAHLRDCRQAL
ncbi:hypothetical protein CALCODRAFT_510043 [Calocera cornea HHB12733]|uniref:Uncharacterized protein n=1 Tax=Calocera cornea HHB12733 TaxID=1353952 RepID=A0A165ETS9_9BASI|nr:hypothetical protein CALCODRAFT_510043 [Calocera cornea HHB12733]